MNMQVEKAQGRPLKGIDRNKVIAQSLRQFARLPGLPDTKKGVRSYQSHVKSDPWLPLCFTALLRRQRGVVAWQAFTDEFRTPLVAWQDPDGTFAAPTSARGTASQTVLGALLLSLQGEHLPVLSGTAPNPWAPAIDAQGKRVGAEGG